MLTLTKHAQTPLTFNQVYTLASAFITGCPESNPALPVKAFPKLAVVPATSGQTAVFDFKGEKDTKYYGAVLVGLSTEYVELSHKGGKYEATLPDGLCGPSYILVTKKNKSTADEDVVAGPVVARLPCNSQTSPSS